MSWLLENLPPRAFVDFMVPKRPDGSDLHACREDGDYSLYVAWLADYLHAVRIPLSPDQERWLHAEERSAQSVIFECSDFYGYALWDLDAIQSWFEEGNSYEEYNAEVRGLWLEHTDPQDREEFPFEELSREAFDRLRREWAQAKAAGVNWTHADIPYRSLLSWALRQISDATLRRNEVDWYFRNFDDNASG